MKEILIITGSDKNSGPNKQLYNLLVTLSKNKKLKITLFICKSIIEKEKSISENLNSIKSIKIVKGPKRNSKILKRSLSNLRLLKELILTNKYQFIQTSGFLPDFFIYIIRLFSTTNFIWITFVRSQIISEYKIRLKPLIFGNLLAFFHKQIINSSEIVICVSKSVAKQMVRKNTQFKVFHNSLSLKDEKEIKLIKKESHLKKNFYDFIFVGHYDYLKNPKEIIDFWIRKNFKKGRLNLYGRKNNEKYYNEMSTMSKLSKEITINDFEENIIHKFVFSDVYISASRTEGCPNTLIEALCSGCICLLSDIPPHREFKDLFPNYIYLFKLNSYLSFENGFKKVLEIIPEKSRWDIMQNSIKFFSSRNLEKSYLNILNSL